MGSQRTVAFGVLLATVVIIASLFVSEWRPASEALQPDTPRKQLPEASESGPSGASRALATTPRVRPGPSPDLRIALPPADSPLAPVLSTLVEAAKAGDVGALCRLSFELHRCEVIAPMVRNGEARAAQRLHVPSRLRADWETTEMLENSLAESKARRISVDRICAGVAPIPGMEPWRLLRDAARRGHVPSMIKFSTSPPLDDRRLLADLEPLEAYRTEAAGFMQRAEDSGSPTAAFYRRSAHHGTGGWLLNFGIYRRDSMQALAYSIALKGVSDERTQRHLDRMELELRNRMSAVEEQEAARVAFNIAQRYDHLRGTGMDIEQNKKLQSADNCD